MERDAYTTTTTTTASTTMWTTNEEGDGIEAGEKVLK